MLAEDNDLVREGVLSLLEAEPGFDVAAACGDLAALLEAVDREDPDVVVTDIRMPPDDSYEGIQIPAKRLRESHPRAGVVVLDQYANPSYGLASLDTGSAGRQRLPRSWGQRPGSAARRRPRGLRAWAAR